MQRLEAGRGGIVTKMPINRGVRAARRWFFLDVA